MEDQGERSPQTFLVNNFFFPLTSAKTKLPIYRVRISSWISSWIFELDFRVGFSS